MKKRDIKPIIFIMLMLLIITILALWINKNNSDMKSVVAEQNENNSEVEKILDELIEEPVNKPEPTEKPTSTPVPLVTNITTTTYYIKVNNEMNTVTVYQQNIKGEYEPIKAMICSTGNATPRNSIYTIKRKYVDENTGWRTLFGHGPYKYVYGQYSQWITGDILFHSVPYIKKYDKSSLEWYEYNKLGTTCSQGCIRLKCSDAKWLYDNCPVGTPVEFYDSADPGPLGKPSFQYISENSPNRGWDPTDPDLNNPWRNLIEDTLNIDIRT